MDSLHMNDGDSPDGDSSFIKSSEPLHSKRQNEEYTDPENINNLPRRLSKLKEFCSNWRCIVLIVTPFVLLPVIFCIPDERHTPVEKQGAIQKCAYMLLMMATYWCTEAMPLAATALIPIFLAPMLGLMSSSDVCVNYLKDLNFLFVGGLMFAVAIEKWDLHKRIALRVLLIVGTKPKMLLFGLTAVTGFLSMWLSNTATAAMMIPIAHAILCEMWKQKKVVEQSPSGSYQLNRSLMDHEEVRDGAPDRLEKSVDEEVKYEDFSPAFKSLAKAISLSICQAANIGGTGTLTGTGPNVIVGGIVKEQFPNSTDLTFGSWMVFATPLTVICLAISWTVLVFIFLGARSLFCCRENPEFENMGGCDVVRREYRKLGPTRFPEIMLLIFFSTLVLLWMSRDPKFAPGWALAIFGNKWVTDASTGIFMTMFLFTFPSSFPCMKSHTGGWKLGPPILDWNSVQHKLPWGVIILLGGGFALANVCEESGLSDWMGCKFGIFSDLPRPALVFICGAIMTLFTEFTSNTSSASIFLPILGKLAVKLRMNPLLLLMPVTICSSFAFSLPVATPPNAIVFSYGHLKVVDMVKTGMLMNLLCLCVTMMAVFTWGDAFFKFDQFPDWANVPVSENDTCRM